MNKHEEEPDVSILVERLLTEYSVAEIFEVIWKSPDMARAYIRACEDAGYEITAQERAFRDPVLECLDKLGGSGEVAEVLKCVERKKGPWLSSTDREGLENGRLRWENNARWARQRLHDEGLITGPHGIWELTDEGKMEVERIKKK